MNEDAMAAIAEGMRRMSGAAVPVVAEVPEALPFGDEVRGLSPVAWVVVAAVLHRYDPKCYPRQLASRYSHERITDGDGWAWVAARVFDKEKRTYTLKLIGTRQGCADRVIERTFDQWRNVTFVFPEASA